MPTKQILCSAPRLALGPAWGWNPRRATLLLIALTLMISGCSMTRNLADDEFLLEKNTIKVKGLPSDISRSDLKRYLLQQPNPRILGLPMSLYIYNWATPNAEKGFSGWLRRVGSAPVIFNQYFTDQSVRNLTTYLNSRGYYRCTISDSVVQTGKKRKRVFYNISLGAPTIIDSLSLRVSDTLLGRYARLAWEKKTLNPGNRLDYQLLTEEAKQIETSLRNQGFYNFTSDIIGFVADTLRTPDSAHVTFHIPAQEHTMAAQRAFKRFYIDSVIVLTRHNPLAPIKPNDTSLTAQRRNNVEFRYPGTPGIRLSALTPMILFQKDSLLRQSLIDRTQTNLLGMGLYQQASIEFREGTQKPIDSTGQELSTRDSTHTRASNTPSPSQLTPAIGYIQLVRRPLQNYQVEMLLTSSGFIGAKGGITYSHRNLFNGSELLELSFQAQIDAIKNRALFRFKPLQEYNVGLTLTVPRFTFPHAPDYFLNISNARTIYKLTFNYQQRPDYTRAISQGLFAFKWNYSTARYTTNHTITVGSLSIIHLIEMTPTFAERIANSYLANSYISQLVTSSGYSFSYAQRASRTHPNTFGLHVNAELAGNLLWVLFYASGRPQVDGAYRFKNLPFAQYAKGDINLTYLWTLHPEHALAFRLFAGVGYPYGNSQALPFDRRYFEGGANGVRAWHTRDLGPGSYYETKLSYPNQTADVKLEANVEYRFSIRGNFEGALFMDAGNIWSISPLDEREGAQFRLSTLPQTTALGHGIGLRYNLSFLILRLDLGIKLYDPAIPPEGLDLPTGHWIPIERSLTINDMVLNFGVGYPF